MRVFSFFMGDRAFVLSLNRSLTLLRAMVIGKSTDVYEELFTYYLHMAEANGLVGPPVRRMPVSSESHQHQRAFFVSATMDFETGQH